MRCGESGKQGTRFRGLRRAELDTAVMTVSAEDCGAMLTGAYANASGEVVIIFAFH